MLLASSEAVVVMVKVDYCYRPLASVAVAVKALHVVTDIGNMDRF